MNMTGKPEVEFSTRQQVQTYFKILGFSLSLVILLELLMLFIFPENYGLTDNYHIQSSYLILLFTLLDNIFPFIVIPFLFISEHYYYQRSLSPFHKNRNVRFLIYAVILALLQTLRIINSTDQSFFTTLSIGYLLGMTFAYFLLFVFIYWIRPPADKIKPQSSNN